MYRSAILARLVYGNSCSAMTCVGRDGVTDIARLLQSAVGTQT